MDKKKKTSSFQLLKYIANASIVAILSLVLIPTEPFKGDGGRWIELLDQARSIEASQLLKIYSVVKSHRMDLNDASVWAITETILEESIKHSLDPLLVLAVISVESRFQEAAVSTEGARGLMQIQPVVANALAKEVDLGLDAEFITLNPESLDDPVLNLKLGIFYLNSLKKSFRDLKLALTAYNWGPTEVKNRIEGDEEVPSEYAMKVLSAYQDYRKHSRQTQKSSGSRTAS